MKMFYVDEREVIVDDTIYDRVVALTWRISSCGYAVRVTGHYLLSRPSRKTYITHFLHHLILPRTKELEVDHINGNKLDNRRENLRLVPCWLNGHNRPAPKNNTSGIKGVTFNTQQGQWRAHITIKRKTTHLGFFDDKEDAVQARKKAEAVLLSPHWATYS